MLGIADFLGYIAAMGRWIFTTVVILLLVVGTYWFLQQRGVKNCYDIGGDWDYSRWTCDT